MKNREILARLMYSAYVGDPEDTDSQANFETFCGALDLYAQEAARECEAEAGGDKPCPCGGGEGGADAEAPDTHTHTHRRGPLAAKDVSPNPSPDVLRAKSGKPPSG